MTFYHLRADRPHHKGPGGRPFFSSTHGGAIPWADLSEDTTFVNNFAYGLTIPAPSSTAYICSELIAYGQDLLGNISISVDSTAWPDCYVSFTPDANAAFVIASSDWPSLGHTMPTFRANAVPHVGRGLEYPPFFPDNNNGTASPNAFTWLAAAGCTIHKTGAITSPTVPSLVSRFFGVFPSNFSAVIHGGKFMPLDSDLEVKSAPTRIEAGRTHEEWVPLGGQFLYATVLDPTGKLGDCVPVPGCLALQIGYAGKFQSSAQIVGEVMNCYAHAMSWPDGIRRIAARCRFDWFNPSAPTTPGAWNGRLYWRPAGVPRFAVAVVPITDGSTYHWPGGYSSTDWMPFTEVPGAIVRDMQADEIGLFLPYGTDLANPTGGDWQVLADVSGSDDGWATATLSGTLPATGQEIIICGGSDFAHDSGEALPLEFAIWPEPAVSPVPIPVARGGVV